MSVDFYPKKGKVEMQEEKTQRRSICIQCGLKSGFSAKCDGSELKACSRCRENNLLCRFKPRRSNKTRIHGGGSLRIANRIKTLSDGHLLASEKSFLEQAKGRVSLITKWNQKSHGIPKSVFKQVLNTWDCLSPYHGIPLPLKTNFPNIISIPQDSDIDEDEIATLTDNRLALPSFELLDSIHGAAADYFARENSGMMGKLPPGLLVALGILVQEMEWDESPEFHGKYLTAEQVMENGPNIKDLIGVDSVDSLEYDLSGSWSDSIFKMTTHGLGEELKYHSSTSRY
jgi:hypothetical protein